MGLLQQLKLLMQMPLFLFDAYCGIDPARKVLPKMTEALEKMLKEIL